jgi:hypothetical protein
MPDVVVVVAGRGSRRGDLAGRPTLRSCVCVRSGQRGRERRPRTRPPRPGPREVPDRVGTSRGRRGRPRRAGDIIGSMASDSVFAKAKDAGLPDPDHAVGVNANDRDPHKPGESPPLQEPSEDVRDWIFLRASRLAMPCSRHCVAARPARVARTARLGSFETLRLALPCRPRMAPARCFSH